MLLYKRHLVVVVVVSYYKTKMACRYKRYFMNDIRLSFAAKKQKGKRGGGGSKDMNEGSYF
jgi:hypothetical protein